MSSTIENTDNEIFSRFKDDKNKLYYSLIKWNQMDDDYLQLLITDSSNTWKLEIGKHDFKRKLQQFDLNQVKAELNQAFKQENSNLKDGYSINIEFNDAFSIKKLLVKKKIDEDISAELIRLELDIVDDPSVGNRAIFDHCLNEIHNLKDRFNYLNQESQRLSDERFSALKEFEKCSDEKINMERDLYSKFVMILDEKKKKIRELKAEIDRFNIDGPPTQRETIGDEVESNNEEDKSSGSKGSIVKINRKTKSKVAKSDEEEVEEPSCKAESR